MFARNSVSISAGRPYSALTSTIALLSPALWLEGPLDDQRNWRDRINGRKFSPTKNAPLPAYMGNRSYLEYGLNQAVTTAPTAALAAADAASLITSRTKYTIAAVMRVPAASTLAKSAGVILGNNTATTPFYFRLVSTGHLQAGFGGTPLDTKSSAPAYSFPIDSWQAVVVSVDTSQTTKDSHIYVAGVDVTKATNTDATIPNAASGWDQPIITGQYDTTVNAGYHGQLACLMFFNDALHRDGTKLTNLQNYLAEIVAGLNS